MPCLLDPPCVQCAFGGKKSLPEGTPKVIMLKADYGCTKGGGDVVETEEGVGLLTSSGIRYLTERGKALVHEKGLAPQFQLEP